MLDVLLVKFDFLNFGKLNIVRLEQTFIDLILGKLLVDLLQNFILIHSCKEVRVYLLDEIINPLPSALFE